MEGMVNMEEVMKKRKTWLGLLVIVLIFGVMSFGCITITPASEIGTIWVSNNSDTSYWIAGPQLRNYNMEYSIRRQPLEGGKEINFTTFEDGTYYIYYRPFNHFWGDTATEPNDKDFRNWNSKSITISNGEVERIQIP